MKLLYMGYVLMENRNGLVVNATVTQASGTAEREAAVEFIDALRGKRRITLVADKNYDTQGFVADTREMKVAPHVAWNDTRRTSAIDGCTTRYPGYGVSQTKRKRMKSILLVEDRGRLCARAGLSGARSWTFNLS